MQVLGVPYFTCAAKHGLMLKPSKVSKLDDSNPFADVKGDSISPPQCTAGAAPTGLATVPTSVVMATPIHDGADDSCDGAPSDASKGTVASPPSSGSGAFASNPFNVDTDGVVATVPSPSESTSHMPPTTANNPFAPPLVATSAAAPPPHVSEPVAVATPRQQPLATHEPTTANNPFSSPAPESGPGAATVINPFASPPMTEANPFATLQKPTPEPNQPSANNPFAPKIAADPNPFADSKLQPTSVAVNPFA
jgi:hypothetical protein